MRTIEEMRFPAWSDITDRDQEIDRLRMELRKIRVAHPPLIAAVTSDIYNKEMARWRAETDLLCGGPEKGAAG